jgi:hypothetical protein
MAREKDYRISSGIRERNEMKNSDPNVQAAIGASEKFIQEHPAVRIVDVPVVEEDDSAQNPRPSLADQVHALMTARVEDVGYDFYQQAPRPKGVQGETDTQNEHKD